MKTYYESGRAVQFDEYGNEYTVSGQKTLQQQCKGYAEHLKTFKGQFENKARTGPAFWSTKENRLVFLMAEAVPVKINFIGAK